MIPTDKETALLDLLGGWFELVQECHEMGLAPRETFEREVFEGEEVDPATYEAWRRHYDEAYLDMVRSLYEDAQDLIVADPGQSADMTPAEFLRDEVLPVLRFRGEEE